MLLLVIYTNMVKLCLETLSSNKNLHSKFHSPYDNLKQRIMLFRDHIPPSSLSYQPYIVKYTGVRSPNYFKFQVLEPSHEFIAHNKIDN